MSLTETERELIDEIIKNTADTTAKHVVAEMLSIHVETCPHGKRLSKFAFICIGAAFGLGTTCADLWPRAMGLFGL